MWATLEELYRRFKEFTRQLWVSVTLFSVSGVLLAVIADRFSGLVPDQFGLTEAAQSVGTLLNVLTTSMLTVTTFSLTIVRGTISQVSSNATPRATQLVAGDPLARETLGTFVGSFLFGIFGIVGLSAGYYDDKGQVILFLATLFVIVLVTVRLVRWITATPDMGRLDDTLQRIETVTKSAMEKWRNAPALGCSAPLDMCEDAVPIHADKSGHVYHISFGMLQNHAHDIGARIVLAVQHGSFVHKGMIVAWVVPDDGDETASSKRIASVADDLSEAIEVRIPRNLEVDPYGGLIALSEIASRALSPGINDPGTAISVLESGVRSFDIYLDKPKSTNRSHDRVHMADVHFEKMLRVFFNPISRDGAGLVEVQIALQRALSAIATQCDGDRKEDVKKLAAQCLERANAGLQFDADRKLLAQKGRGNAVGS